MDNNTQKEREELIELFGIHFESVYNLPPLCSRILGLLIVEACKSGLTFEQIVEKVGASKSSVSTNLNFLLKMGKIDYYTLHGDRKKYFRPSPFSERFSNYLKILEFEKKIIDKMISYREKTMDSSEERINLEHAKAYKSHVIKVEELLQETISEFIEIEKVNNK
jgi:DNA-binding transcriptional regulator GbsR (MarR family)